MIVTLANKWNEHNRIRERCKRRVERSHRNTKKKHKPDQIIEEEKNYEHMHNGI